MKMVPFQCYSSTVLAPAPSTQKGRKHLSLLLVPYCMFIYGLWVLLPSAFAANQEHARRTSVFQAPQRSSVRSVKPRNFFRLLQRAVFVLLFL